MINYDNLLRLGMEKVTVIVMLLWVAVAAVVALVFRSMGCLGRISRFSLFVLTSFLASGSVIAEAAPLRVGVISGLSGIAAKWNRFQNMGMQLAREEINASGTELELIFEDSATQGARVISAFNKLSDFDKVDAIIIDDFGFVAAPLLPIVRQRGSFLYAISLPQDSYCEQGGPTFFSGTSQFSNSRDAFERYFTLNPNIKRIALAIFDDPEWGNTYKSIWTDLAIKHGVEVVDVFLSDDFAPDFVPPVSRFIHRRAEAIFVAHEPERFFKAARQLKFKGDIVAANNVLEMLADTEVRPEIEGVYMVDPEISEEFRQKFIARFKRLPILEAYAGYEAVRATVAALSKNRTAPANAMHELKYRGVAGEIDFSGKTCAGNQARWALYRFQKGRQIRQ
ncbi:MAG: ABC transporter substrate-binding protein [Oligoflexia bacterium]|nr:ABC transporter substrate-binding protein [Oligoflexia bacterium]